MLNNDVATQRALLVAEFTSLRAESASAKQNQQSVFQWTVAAIGAVWAATVAFSESSATTFVSLAVVLPVIAASGFAAWIGEVQRMERAGRFLRAREVAFSVRPPVAVNSPLAPASLPIMWESLIYDDAGGKGFDKDLFGSLGAIFLFGMTFYGSLLAARQIIPTLPQNEGWLAGVSPTVLDVWLVVAAVAFALIFAPALLRLKRRSHGRLAEPADSRLPANVSVDIVMPCLNEALALPWVASRVPAGARPTIVDNASSDYSAETAELLQFSVLRVDSTVGIGAATQVGIRHGKADFICVMDCDGTVDPAAIVELLQPLVEGRSDLVIATRKFKLREIPHQCMMGARTLIMRCRFGMLAPSQIGSMRVFRRDALDSSKIAGLAPDNGWSLDLTLTFLGSVAPDRVAYVPLQYRPRIGQSKITGTLRGAWQTALQSLRVIWRHQPNSLRNAGLRG